MLHENDHRRIGQALDLFHLQEEAPGAVFWHPRGLAVVRALEEHVRRVVHADGYEEVRTPAVFARSLWEQSGHWQGFSAAMMAVGGGARAALKPVSCPAHVQIVLRRRRRSADPPVRLSELGVVHRNERKSQHLGLFRLRQFTQDDGHVFCADADVEAEVARFCVRARGLYASFGYDRVEALLSLRPAVRRGSDALWDRAERALASAVEAAGIAFDEQPGAGAFYGPKLELVLRDARGRPWQCGTIQLDFVLPERFGLGGAMLHRAMLGSVERFLGIRLEHREGKLPAWLAPESVRVVPVGSSGSSPYGAYAGEVLAALRGRALRAGIDARDLPLAARVKRVHEERVPLVVVVGPRDAERRRIAVREDGAVRDLAFDAGVHAVAEACAPPPV